ncbi:MAG: hypothetical protein IKC69_04560 [Clostridia bacterium]|nr:hypothetical protein [Clostridia bacterium]
MESGLGKNAEISLNASDEALGLLSSFVGEEYDLSFLNDLTLKTSVGREQGVGAVALDLYLKKNGVLSLEAIADRSTGTLYLSLPELNEKALMLDAEGLKQAPASPIPARVLAASLPEGDALTPMLKDYLKIALGEIGDVTSHKESVTVGEKTRDATVLEYTLDREATCRLIRALLTEWKKDRRASEILAKLAEEMTSLGLAESPEAFLEEYEKGLDALLEKPEVLLEGLSEEEKIKVEVLVSSSHEILGRRFSMGDNTSLSCITFREGEGFESELCLKGEKEITLTGKGTEKDGAVTGEFSVTVGETDLGRLGLDGLAISEETGRLSGSVFLYPAKSVMKTLLGDAGGVLTALNTGLEIRFGEKDGKEALDLFLTAGSLRLLEINVVLTKAEKREISIPEKSDCRDGASKMELALWGLGLDLQGLYSDLEKAGAEEGTVELIRSLVDRIKDSLF